MSEHAPPPNVIPFTPRPPFMRPCPECKGALVACRTCHGNGRVRVPEAWDARHGRGNW